MANLTDPAVHGSRDTDQSANHYPSKSAKRSSLPETISVTRSETSPGEGGGVHTHVIVVSSKDKLPFQTINNVVGRSLRKDMNEQTEISFDGYDSESSSSSVSKISSEVSYTFLEDSDGENREINRRESTRRRNKGVSKRFIKLCNSRVGNNDDIKEAKGLIQQMRQLAGLEQNPNKEINIPNARLGLSMLIEINDQEIKVEALDSLLESLEQDEYEKNTSPKLVEIASKLMKKMNKQLIQTQTVDVQIKMAQVYSSLAFLIQRHYGKSSLNGITGQFKKDLINTAQALQRLNRLEDPKLSFYVKCAIEGFLRLKDDRKELFELFERVYQGLTGAISLYLRDAQEGFPRIEKAFGNIDITLSHSWYDKTLILKSLAKIVSQEKHVVVLLLFIHKNAKSSNWKFVYACIETLYQLALYHPNKQVRNRAFNGIKQYDDAFPGLVNFIDTKNLHHYLDMGPIIHFQKPKIKNPNEVIKQGCLKFLADLAENAPDESIQNKAKALLKQHTPRNLKSSTQILLERYESEKPGS